MNIKINELRAILFHVNNQQLTIEELRSQLFKIDNTQDFDNPQDFDKIFNAFKI